LPNFGNQKPALHRRSLENLHLLGKRRATRYTFNESENSNESQNTDQTLRINPGEDLNSELQRAEQQERDRVRALEAFSYESPPRSPEPKFLPNLGEIPVLAPPKIRKHASIVSTTSPESVPVQLLTIRPRSISSDYPTEGMRSSNRSPAPITSPPSTFGRRIFTNFDRDRQELSSAEISEIVSSDGSLEKLKHDQSINRLRMAANAIKLASTDEACTTALIASHVSPAPTVNHWPERQEIIDEIIVPSLAYANNPLSSTVVGQMTYVGSDGDVRQVGPAHGSLGPQNTFTFPTLRTSHGDDKSGGADIDPVITQSGPRKSKLSLHLPRKHKAKASKQSRTAPKRGIFSSIRHWLAKRLGLSPRKHNRTATGTGIAQAKRRAKHRRQGGAFEPTVGQRRGPRVAKKGKKTSTVRINLDAAGSPRICTMGQNALFAGGRVRSSGDRG
jgi:hypothetical protein